MRSGRTLRILIAAGVIVLLGGTAFGEGHGGMGGEMPSGGDFGSSTFGTPGFGAGVTAGGAGGAPGGGGSVAESGTTTPSSFNPTAQAASSGEKLSPPMKARGYVEDINNVLPMHNYERRRGAPAAVLADITAPNILGSSRGANRTSGPRNDTSAKLKAGLPVSNGLNFSNY